MSPPKGEAKAEINESLDCKLQGWGTERGDPHRTDNNKCFVAKTAFMAWAQSTGLRQCAAPGD